MQQIGNPCLEYYSVTSTMDIARDLARRGVPHGTLVTATHQTNGRGRRGAQWHDQETANALMTFVLRPEIKLNQIWRLSFIASLACAKYLRSAGLSTAQVKWPNDLVASGHKLGGLLIESANIVGAEGVFLLGIGINVLQTEFDDAELFVLPPTSVALELASKDHPTVRQVIAGIALSLDEAFREHLASGPGLIDAWNRYQVVGHNQTGIAIDTGNAVTGVYRSVRSDDGAGLIALEDGAEIAIMPSAT